MQKFVIPEEVREDYERWRLFLEHKVEFWLPDSEKHTKEHCARVLLYCLLIARRMALPREDVQILCMASVFHDSRRQDDWLDVGHGQRAADYYRAWCGKTELPFDQRCYDIMAFHDRDDATGVEAISGRVPQRENAVLLYQIFKDADALDRFRLGPSGLDVNYLRTDAARSLYDYAKDVWYRYFADPQEQEEGELHVKSAKAGGREGC